MCYENYFIYKFLNSKSFKNFVNDFNNIYKIDQKLKIKLQPHSSNEVLPSSSDKLKYHDSHKEINILSVESKDQNNFINGLVCDEDIWPFVIASLFVKFRLPLFILTATNDRAKQLNRELKMLFPLSRVMHYPSLGNSQILSLIQKTKFSYDLLSQRSEILNSILEYKNSSDPFFITAAENSIIDLIPPVESFISNLLILEKNKEYDRDKIISSLLNLGYERVNKVYDKGEFSFKGDMLDIFNVSSDYPCRVDFFEDKIENIFSYDLSNFNLIEQKTALKIFPNANISLKQNFEQKDLIERDLNNRDLKEQNLQKQDLQGQDSQEQDLKEQHQKFQNKRKNISIIDFLADAVKEFILVICDPIEVDLKLKSDIELIYRSLQNEKFEKFEKFEKIEKIENNLNNIIINKNFLTKLNKFHFETANFKDFNFISDRNIYLLNLLSTKIESENFHIFTLESVKRQKKCKGNPEIFIENIKKDFVLNKEVAIAIGSEDKVNKITRLLSQSDISFNMILDKKAEKQETTQLQFKNIVNIYKNNLLTGFEDENFSLYGELDIYQESVFKGYFDKNEAKIFEGDDYIYDLKKEEFKPGDFVVHKTHGIGKYIDIVSEQTNGNKKEFFLIEYANNDKLYVPVWQSDRIHKYIGDKNPTISELNSSQWSNLKKKVRNSVKKLAFDLASLYAERNVIEGYAFTENNIWQEEMEELFPFEETEDQIKAINYVKQLMEKPKPMDLLLCGDVGFGKTEVAVRAAFKAIMNSKQVLMLVPTTILADQHFKTFYERFKNFPVTVEVLSRFKSEKEQKIIIENFKDGKIDMLIGTHRILSEDVKPKDLGLVIIDEEQRFGVNAKEKIKLLKKNVDVITLSATPIPRTLYMSLTGVRDIFLIETHPAGRFPIETFVGEKNDLLIKMAVEREIRRGGQVFYIYNRIKDIDQVKNKLQILLPTVKIALTHGQMEGKKIENIMESFINKKYDVLLTTSIIESGMDISNVNTLIVENAHRFGLSQLYQLRGRVGRSYEKAYAYFFYPKRIVLNLQAFQRLKTLAEYTDLGSGYKIAMKDLEIRGAGELLGAKQHGHINSVGFDLYCQIVNEEIEKLKGKEIEQDYSIQIELPVSAYIPRSYIRTEKERISLYKDIGSFKEPKEADNIIFELEKRHGVLPDAVKNIIAIGKIKCLAKKAEIEKIIFLKSRGLTIKKVNINSSQEKLLMQKYNNLYYNSKNKEIILKLKDEDLNVNVVLKYLDDIIKIISLSKSINK